MSGSVNKVILVGNLGRDPEVRRLNSGEPVVSFSLATTESWRDKATGERKEWTMSMRNGSSGVEDNRMARRSLSRDPAVFNSTGPLTPRPSPHARSPEGVPPNDEVAGDEQPVGLPGADVRHSRQRAVDRW